VVGGTLSGNVAEGGQGGTGLMEFGGATVDVGGHGGNGFGGGTFIAAGTVRLTSVTAESNSAIGAPASVQFSNFPGNGYGGSIYAGGGTLTLCSDTVESNSAPTGQLSGYGYGGGIYIVSGATVYIDSFTVAHTINNTDSSGLNGSTANINGPFILKNC